MNNQQGHTPSWPPQQPPSGQLQWDQPAASPYSQYPSSPPDAPTVPYLLPPQEQPQWRVQHPGQFQSRPYPRSTHPYAPGSYRGQAGGLGQWFRTRSRRVKVSLVCGIVLAVLLFFAVVGAAIGSGTPSTVTPPSGQPAATSPTAPATVSPTLAATTTPTATPSPSPTATPTPTPSPTAQPTPSPTATPVPQLALTFTCAQAVDYSYGRVCVHTQAGAALTITVTYCSGYKATSASLQGTVFANGGGYYEWDWTPETKCRGTATADVSANWHGQSTSQSTTFPVQ